MPYGGLFPQNIVSPAVRAAQIGGTDAEKQLRTSVGPSTHISLPFVSSIQILEDRDPSHFETIDNLIVVLS